ncbi:hypothetical protein FRC11_000873 [Ceratobasidium sp. 423]|nr:hypothetical protein FRC11_000873 [Ceratobasidium sp. 423]
METIPTEILTECLAYLEPHDLVNVLSVSTTLRGAASQDALWRTHCERIYNKGSSDVIGWRSAEQYHGLAAIKHSGVTYGEEGYAIAASVPTLSLPRGLSARPFVAIHSPFEESDHSTPIAGGIWVASYGEVHGCEFVHLHVRIINERDLNGQWGDEGSLATAVTRFGQDVQSLFDLPAPPPLILSPEDIKVGDTIIEATKVTGDVNVPRGVRTFVGFLDHRDAWSGPSENGDFVPRPPSHPWPLVPGSTIQREMPATALPADLAEMRTQDTPARGMTMPGLMRVSETEFLDPKWANATVHIANRREIRVMLLDGHHVTTFYKIEKSMFEPMN